MSEKKENLSQEKVLKNKPKAEKPDENLVLYAIRFQTPVQAGIITFDYVKKGQTYSSMKSKVDLEYKPETRSIWIKVYNEQSHIPVITIVPFENISSFNYLTEEGWKNTTEGKNWVVSE